MPSSLGGVTVLDFSSGSSSFSTCRVLGVELFTLGGERIHLRAAFFVGGLKSTGRARRRWGIVLVFLHGEDVAAAVIGILNVLHQRGVTCPACAAVRA